jgi:hypothetical protein
MTRWRPPTSEERDVLMRATEAGYFDTDVKWLLLAEREDELSKLASELLGKRVGVANWDWVVEA